MAKHDVKYVCGCGFSTVSMSKAIEHSDSYGHQMTAQGTIIPDPALQVFNLHKNTNTVPHYTPPPRPQRAVPHQPKAVEQDTSAELRSSFDALRKKLNGGG